MRIKTLHDLGYGVMDISRDSKVSMHRNSIGQWIKRFEEAAAKNIPDEQAVLSQPRSGAPVKATKLVQNKIIKHAKGKRKRGTRKVVKWLHGKGIDVSRSTVRRVLHNHSLFPYKRSKQPRLTAAQKTKRVRFAREYRNHDWENTLMTDESDFNLFAATNPQNDRIWHDDPDQVPPQELVNHASGVKVWAGVSATGRTSLHFYEGTLGADRYLEILEERLPEMEAAMEDDEEWCFQHDGASAHKAKVTNAWLEDHVPSHIVSGTGPAGKGWPGNSPDLNWIENVWAWMDAQLEEKPPQTTLALKRRLKKIWKDMPQDMLAKMAAGMDQRLKDVIAKGGDFTGK